eukprot:83304_1
MEHWTRPLWWLLFGIIPIIVRKFHFITKSCIGLFNKTPDYNGLTPKSQIKVQLKTMRVICFGTSFIIALMGLSILWSQGIFYVEDLPYWTDKALKYGLVCVSSVYVLDIVYYRQHLAWYNWLHHSMSLLVFLCVFDYNFSFIVSRIYCAVLGMLLTSRWILHFASLYYYLGNEEHTEIRIGLYACGLIVHAIFTFGQFIVGLIFKISHNRSNTGRWIFWIVFEIAVLPSQLHTFYDIYCIIKIKIYSKAFSSKIDRFSMADPIKNNADLRHMRAQTVHSLSGDSTGDDAADIMEISDDEQGFSLPATEVCVNELGQVHQQMKSNVSLSAIASDIMIETCGIDTCVGYSYSNAYGLDVQIDEASQTVCLFGKIQCSKIQALNGFFKGNIAKIVRNDAWPLMRVRIERDSICNDQKYKVVLTISPEGMITADSSVELDEIEVDKENLKSLRGVIKLDGIAYQAKSHIGWD